MSVLLFALSLATVLRVQVIRTIGGPGDRTGKPVSTVPAGLHGHGICLHYRVQHCDLLHLIHPVPCAGSNSLFARAGYVPLSSRSLVARRPYQRDETERCTRVGFGTGGAPRGPGR